jgi:ectoine hydroxylase-related dioxygenase (phytanoyl-CoA dioxygenase family)
LASALGRAREDARASVEEPDGQLARDSFLSRYSPELAEFALDPRLGAVAAELLGASGIRLIHDVELAKGREHRSTPWHRDCDFWSFTGAGALTMWIPLQETPVSMSPLRYASGSHLADDLRPLRRVEKLLIPMRYTVSTEALGIGDVAVHHYETLHGAARNREARVRRAFAVHLFDADARFRSSTQAGHEEHARRCGWDKLRDGEPFDDTIAPLVYRR